jgi:hypothetical protein
LFRCCAIPLFEVEECEIGVGAFVVRLEFYSLVEITGGFSEAILEDVGVAEI